VRNGLEQEIVFLGRGQGFAQIESISPRVSVYQTLPEVGEFVKKVLSGNLLSGTLVSFNNRYTDALTRTLIDQHMSLSEWHFLTILPPREHSIDMLHLLWKSVSGLAKGVSWLAPEELATAIASEERSDRFLGGSVDIVTKTVTFFRGSCEKVIVPFSLFPRSGEDIKPDFRKLGFTDYGRTVVFGKYEAAVDAVLYEVDPEYRRRLNKQRKDSERSLGASIRRLRKQKRLSQKDFAPIPEKTIARIERNEVKTPHAATLRTIADKLGIDPNEIQDY